jgi:hypothetical protein
MGLELGLKLATWLGVQKGTVWVQLLGLELAKQLGAKWVLELG